MKRFLILLVAMTFFTAAIPVFVYKNSAESIKLRRSAAEAGTTVVSVGSASASDGETVEVFLSEDKKTQKMSIEDYIIGVVAAEMPAEYEPEALKAQALAAASYARYEQKHKNKPVSDDTDTAQGYMSVKEMKDAWGDDFEKNYEKIKQAARAVSGLSLEYDGEPVLAVYFALSSGKTENAEDIWGKEYPYLKSVSSDGDILSSGYESTVSVGADELVSRLGKIKKLKPEGDPDGYIGEIKRTDAGTVTSVEICSESFTGSEIRSCFGLASAVFEVEYEDGGFVFTSKGYGHGVGMSQYGADYMARQGADFAEILLHYYNGAKIVQKGYSVE